MLPTLAIILLLSSLRKNQLFLSLRSEGMGASSPAKGSSCSVFVLWFPTCSVPQFPKGSGWGPFILPGTCCFPSSCSLPGAERPAPPFHPDLWTTIPMETLHWPASLLTVHFPRAVPLSLSPGLCLKHSCCYPWAHKPPPQPALWPGSRHEQEPSSAAGGHLQPMVDL